jgi:hypothetical protein
VHSLNISSLSEVRSICRRQDNRREVFLALVDRVAAAPPEARPVRVLRLRLGKRIGSINVCRLAFAQDDGLLGE